MKSTPVIHSQPSWIVRSNTVELAVTKLGGHMAPVTFCRDQAQPVQPYAISPWQDEKLKNLLPVLAPLRGDFFCLPFGNNARPYRGERHPVHGETCSSPWSLESCAREGDAVTLRLSMKTKVRPGTVHREFTLLDGHNAVYCRTSVEGFRGRASVAHHAILRTPEQERALFISTSKFDIGRTYPVPSATPSEGEYQSLQTDAAFKSLASVPSIFKGEPNADCSAFPVRRGFGDLLQQFEKPSKSPSWVAAVNIEEGWLWYALKNSAVLPGRLFWIENHSRHAAPWNGRTCSLGIEDGCMYFDRGLAASVAPNPINRQGIPTSLRFPAEIRYIQGAIRIPRGFNRVHKAKFPAGSAIFESESGKTVAAAVNHDFLF